MIYYLYIYIYNNWFCIVLHPIKIAGITSQTKMWISNPKPARATGKKSPFSSATLRCAELSELRRYSDRFLLATPRHHYVTSFSRNTVVFHKPIHRSLDPLPYRRELEIGLVTTKLFVGRSLLELAIGFRGILGCRVLVVLSYGR